MAAPSSQTLRERGNQLLQQARAEGLAPVLKEGRLNSARECYLKAARAAEAAGCASDHASAMKNCGVVAVKLAALGEGEPRFQQYVAASQFFSRAMLLGQRDKDADWHSGCFNYAMDVFSEMEHMATALTLVKQSGDKNGQQEGDDDEADDSDEEDSSEEDDDAEEHTPTPDESATSLRVAHVNTVLAWLHRALRALPDEDSGVLRGLWCLRHAGLLLQLAVTELGRGRDADFKTCRRLLAEAHRPAELARVVFEQQYKPELSADAQTLQHELDITMFQVEAREELARADDIVARQMFVELTPAFGMVWVAMDMYKLSVVLSREMDLENEAIALSRIGRLYDKVIKDTKRAGACYARVLVLEEALKPRYVANQAWCREAHAALRRYQEEAARREESEATRRKEPFLKELAPELAALKAAAAEGNAALLRHIYAKHAPKAKNSNGQPLTLREEPTAENAKDLLRLAFLAYHPDKQREAEHGEKWCVLCGEITIFLNAAYGVYFDPCV